MNTNMQYSERNANIWSRFCEMVRKTAARSSRSSLDFYSHSTVSALLTMQSVSRSEQL